MLSNVGFFKLMVKILINHFRNVCKHGIGQKIHVKAWNFECEMHFNEQNGF